VRSCNSDRGEFPQCHAEFVALEKKLGEMSLLGATVYTTLEPCTVRNSPKLACASRLADRKVARVVIGMLEPDKRVRGLGQIMLRKARIVTDFFPPDLMEEVEEINRDLIRDRESRQNLLPDDVPRAPVAPKVRVALVHGHASNFLLKYTNDEDEPVLIHEVRLFSGKVELTEPLVPDDESAWKVGAHSSEAFGKNILQNRNPAASLIKMNSHKGLFFETEMDVVVECELRGQRLEARHTLYVKVNAASNTIVPLV
jgi:tRNA(Arg) A34 adenosine deaminase TadA